MKFAICILTPLALSVETKGQITHRTRAASNLISCKMIVRALTRRSVETEQTITTLCDYDIVVQ